MTTFPHCPPPPRYPCAWPACSTGTTRPTIGLRRPMNTTLLASTHSRWIRTCRRHTGPGPQDHDVLAGSHLRAGDEHAPRGHERQGDRRGLGELHVRRDRQHIPGGDRDLLRVRPGEVLPEDLVVRALGVLAPQA